MPTERTSREHDVIVVVMREEKKKRKQKTYSRKMRRQAIYLPVSKMSDNSMLLDGWVAAPRPAGASVS